MVDIGTFIKDNFWIPILAGVLLIALIIILVYCLCRRRSRYEYETEPLLYSGDIGISQRFNLEDMHRQKVTKSTAEYNAQFYVRSHLAYSNVEPMAQLGSRPQKSWFRIYERNSNAHMLMSMCEAPKDMCVQFTSSTARSIKDMIQLLKYPYIYPIHDIDFMVDQNIIVVVYPICRRGSLKDFIYQCSCMDNYRVKYVSSRRGLNVTQLRAFGKQILKALIYMEERGFPMHGHVHAGNVMIDNNSCRLMGIENSFMGFEPKLRPLIKRYIRKKPDAIDVVSFGHLLFEMCLGRELETAQPQPADLSRCEAKSHDIVEVLNFIFPSDKKSFPSLCEVADHKFFQDVPLPALEQFSISAISLNREMKNIVKAVRKGIPAKKSVKRRNSKSVQRSASEDNHQQLKPPAISHQNSVPAPPTSGQAPPAPPPPPSSAPPPPPPSFAPPPPNLAPPPPPAPSAGAPPLPPSSSGRGALLGDIRKGMKLKKAKTNDRSAPKV